MARVNWVDRVPTKPGRVRLMPVEGDSNLYDMTREDAPQVEGTPLNAANLNAMQEGTGLTENVTIYVANSGSDNTGNGTSTAPYATITKALSTIPKSLNGYTARVYIANGAYPEKLIINGFTGGTLMFTGNSNANISVTSISIQHTEMLIFRNLHFSVTGGSDVLYGVHTTASCMVVDTGSFSVSNASVSGIYAILGATVYFTTLTLSAVGNAVTATNGAQIIVGTITGVSTDNGLRATAGGRIFYGNNTLSTPTMHVTASGGRILAGSQMSIPNY